jgi:hypothetical protein
VFSAIALDAPTIAIIAAVAALTRPIFRCFMVFSLVRRLRAGLRCAALGVVAFDSGRAGVGPPRIGVSGAD